MGKQNSPTEVSRESVSIIEEVNPDRLMQWLEKTRRKSWPDYWNNDLSTENDRGFIIYKGFRDTSGFSHYFLREFDYRGVGCARLVRETLFEALILARHDDFKGAYEMIHCAHDFVDYIDNLIYAPKEEEGEIEPPAYYDIFFGLLSQKISNVHNKIKRLERK